MFYYHLSFKLHSTIRLSTVHVVYSPGCYLLSRVFSLPPTGPYRLHYLSGASPGGLRYISGPFHDPPSGPPNDPTPDPTSGWIIACPGGGRRATGACIYAF